MNFNSNDNLKKLALLMQSYIDEENYSYTLFSEILEKLEALEIIKEKRVNVNCIISGWTLGKYNSYQAHISLTQKEYDLLKEVLNND